MSGDEITVCAKHCPEYRGLRERDAALEDHITALHEQIARQKTRIAELEDERGPSKYDVCPTDVDRQGLLLEIRDKRLAELEAECGKLRSLLRDDRDCWARNDELEARNAKLEAALRQCRDIATLRNSPLVVVTDVCGTVDKALGENSGAT